MRGHRRLRRRRTRPVQAIRGGLARLSRRMIELERGHGMRQRRGVKNDPELRVPGANVLSAYGAAGCLNAKRPLPHNAREGPFATQAPRYSVGPPEHVSSRPVMRPRALVRRRTAERSMIASIRSVCVTSSRHAGSRGAERRRCSCHWPASSGRQRVARPQHASVATGTCWCGVTDSRSTTCNPSARQSSRVLILPR